MNFAKLFPRVFLALIFWANALAASDYDRVKPKEPEQEGGAPDLSAPENKTSADDKVLVQQLKGVVFVASPDEVKKTAASAGVDTGRVEFLDNETFRSLIAPYLDKPVSMKSISEMVKATVLYFRRNDHPLVSVTVPEQDITSGVVQLLVVEAKLDKIRVDGNRWFKDSQISDKIRAQPGDPVSASSVIADIEYINSNPFRYVRPVFSPGEKFGTTDLTLQETDRIPFRLFSGFENSGNATTGKDRYFSGFNWGNAFGREDELGYQFMADTDTQHFKSNSGYYRIPLPNRQKLEFFGSYSESDALIPDNTDFSLQGISWQASLRYKIPLRSFAGWKQEAAPGFDFKSFNTNLDFGGTQVFASAIHVTQFVLQYNCRKPDRFGKTALSFSGYFSPGSMASNQSAQDYSTARVYTNPEYHYGTLSLERDWNLPRGFELINRATGQISDSRLQGSEQMGFGGYDSVRGYEEHEVYADEGFVANVEVWSPKIPLPAFGKDSRFASTLRFLLFWDYGYAHIKDPTQLEKQLMTLSSVGCGMRYNLGSHVSLSADYGYQLDDVDENTDNNEGMHISFVVGF